jgi:hypothetical protein
MDSNLYTLHWIILECFDCFEISDFGVSTNNTYLHAGLVLNFCHFDIPTNLNEADNFHQFNDFVDCF